MKEAEEDQDIHNVRDLKCPDEEEGHGKIVNKVNKQKTSIQHLSREPDDSETGPYMKAVEQKVDSLARSIQAKGKQLKESLAREEIDKKIEEPGSPFLFTEDENENLKKRIESEKEMLTDLEDSIIILDTDSDNEEVHKIANDVNKKLLFNKSN